MPALPPGVTLLPLAKTSRKTHLKDMLHRLRSLLGPSSAPAAPDMSGTTADLPHPASTTYVVGDVHGRADLLELMLELIDAHIGGTASTDPQLVFVGDYIDHGPDSAGVLARLSELTRDFPDNVTCLMGNHERMLLDFLADPALRGPRWLREGGVTTLESFHVHTSDLDAAAEPRAWNEAARRLSVELGSDTLAWLAARPLSWSSGNLWAVHAGADPQRAMEDQTARVLLWGHPEFDNSPRGDDIWVAHGHVERDAPLLANGRISCDTAAWSTGRLSACAIRPDGSYDFLQT